MLTARRAAATFRRFESLVRRTAGGFVKLYGGDFDEVFADACLLFVLSCGTWDETRGPFARHARYKMWNGLRKGKGVKDRRGRLLGQVPYDLAAVQTNDEEPAFVEVIESLSEDGKEVVYLALYPPVDVRFAADERGKTPRGWRGAITEHLRDIGWPRDRVRAAVKEVRDAFSGG